MDQQAWLALFTAALGGGLTVKLVEIAHQEFKAWRTARSSGSRTVEASLEPLLRAADELSGKLRSLAEQDFVPIRDADTTSLNDTGLASVVYLFVQFWSEVEIVRFHGLTTATARSRRGKHVRAFLACLESRRLRLIDRTSQRAIGETALVHRKTMNYVEFVKSYDTDPYTRRWLAPLMVVLSSVRVGDVRQKILQYAIVVHALVDTLDAAHHVTKERPATPNKLNTKSWRALNYRVFGVYLTFVTNRAKYIGSPKIS